MKTIILFFALSFLSVSGHALQQKNFSVSGRVTDDSGIPLAGAGVIIENSFLGTHSDAEGKYSLNNLVSGEYAIRFTFVGHEPQVRVLELKGNSVLNVVLASEALVTGEVIVNATRADSRTPMTFSTVDRDMIEKTNAGMDIPFLLGLTPSLVETSEAGNGVGYTNLRIRGTDASRINVTIDGIPLNDPESQQVFWVDIPDLASSVDNIQVQRGVGTSSNGAGAFGATVSIQTKNPSGEPFAEIVSSAGSFNTFRNSVSAGTGLLAERFALQMRMSQLKSDGFIKRSGSDHRSSYISGVYTAGRSRLRANILIGEEHTGLAWWGVPEDMLETDRRYNPSGEYTDDEGVIQYYDNESDNYRQDHYQLIYGYGSGGGISLSTALHYTRGKGYYEQYREGEDMSDYLPVPSLETDLITRKWMANDFFGVVASLKIRNEKSETTLGGGANRYVGDHFGTIIWSQASDVQKDQQWYFNNGTKSEGSIYAKTTWNLTERISVYGDLQYRYISYDMTGDDDDGKDLKQQHTFGFFNPKAGLFWSLSSNQEGYLSFSVAGREPARTDFKEAAGDPDATPRAERLYDTEAGYRIRGRVYSLGLNAYLMYYSDQLVPTGELSSTGYPVMTNVKRSYRNGLEITAGLKPLSFVEWKMNLALSSNKISDFTEYYVDYDTATGESEYKSKYIGKVDIAYSPSITGTSDIGVGISPAVEFHLISKYVGRQYFDNTMSSERMLKPYFISNLMLSYEPAVNKIKQIRVQLFVNNILNSMYASNAYGGNLYESGEEKSWAYYFPQAGINFMVRAAVTF